VVPPVALAQGARTIIVRKGFVGRPEQIEAVGGGCDYVWVEVWSDFQISSR
jgi:hypothetical protein